MAIKAALAAALLAAAMVALASATTTTVTTTTVSEGGPWKKLVCWQQLQGRDLSSCQQYLSPYGGVLEMSTQQGQVEECCQELRAMDRVQCGCEAIKKVVQQAQQEQGRSWTYETGKSESQSQSEQIYRKASSLPTICRLRDQQCQIPLVLV